MGHTILFVDDEPNIIDGFKRTFHKEPFEIICALSAERAMLVLEKEDIDVVVSDELMDGMSGTEFLSLARDKYPDVIRIMLTGKASLDLAMKAINNGEIFRFLTKPCSDSDLISAIRQALYQKDLIIEFRRLLQISKKQLDIIKRLEQETRGISYLGKSQTGSIVINDPGSLSELVKELSDKLSLSEEILGDIS